MINMEDVYIRKPYSNVWTSAMDFWVFYTHICSIEKRNPSEKSFFDTINSLGYEVRNLNENPTVIDYLRIGYKIRAIKLYKDLHHVSLLEAKIAVEKIV